MQVLISSSDDGVLIPIPQYPLYTAALALNSAIPVPYYLQESVSWGLDIEGIKTQIADSRAEGTKLKAMVVINPGNPTGNCLTRENIEDIIKLCYHEHLVLFADEVYQDNIYLHSRPFESFKKVLKELGEPYSNSLELVSFHSISKGQTGECGRRGGYFELCNFHPEAEEQIYKMASIQLCPPISGQIGVDVLINPPQEGEESYELWTKERAAIAKTLKGRSEVLEEAFNKLEGISCNAAEVSWHEFLGGFRRVGSFSNPFFSFPRVPCTFSQPSPFHPKRSKLPRLPTVNRTLSTLSNSSMRPEFASSPVLDSGSKKAPGTSAPLSSHLGRKIM